MIFQDYYSGHTEPKLSFEMLFESTSSQKAHESTQLHAVIACGFLFAQKQ